MSKIKVSIVIVSYNTKELLLSCIASIKKFADVSYEIIISDNGSTDGTLEALTKIKEVVLVENKVNLGFAKGNNAAKKISKGEYILFLNPDTLLHKNALSESVSYLNKNKKTGALTCKVVLLDGSLDKDTRRSFPTPFIALTHFSGLDRIFPKSPLFSRYWYGYADENITQEIDALQGAFLLSPKKVLDSIGWFDEDYFLDGEDIDLCWKIKNLHLKVIYFPKVSITHIKKGSKKKNKSLKSVTGGVTAMQLFYEKRLSAQYPFYVNGLVLFGIQILKFIRTIKYYLS